MSQQVRQHDWARTPLGPIEHWPEALRISVDIILSSHFPCCLVWGPQRISIYNDGFVPILGNKPAPLGRPFDDIWREAWNSIGPIAERTYQGQATFIEDYPVELDRHGRPEMGYFTFCYSPLRDADGQVLGMLDTVIETTSRVTAERQLRQLTHNLERQVAERTRDRNRLWNLSPDIMLVSRQDLVITAANPATQNILGWSEAELVGSNCLDLVHPDDLADAWAAIHSLVQGEPLRDYASRMRHRDGSYRWINWSSSSGDGFISAIGRDTTEERARAIDFSAPVYEWGEGIVVSDKAKRRYGKFEDMQGQKVGVLVDSVQFNMIKDMPGTKVSTYQDYSTLLADVRAGRIDLGIVDPPSIIYQIKTKNIPGVKLDTSYQPQRKWQVGMAVQKGNATLLEAVNAALAEMKRNGELAAIGQKWGVSNLLSK